MFLGFPASVFRFSRMLIFLIFPRFSHNIPRKFFPFSLLAAIDCIISLISLCNESTGTATTISIRKLFSGGRFTSLSPPHPLHFYQREILISNSWHVVRSKTIPPISANFSPILFHFLVDYKTITPTCHAFYYQEKISVEQNLANSIPLFIFAILLFFLVSNSILLLSFDCSVDSVWSSIVKVSFRWHFYVQKH